MVATRFFQIESHSKDTLKPMESICIVVWFLIVVNLFAEGILKILLFALLVNEYLFFAVSGKNLMRISTKHMPN